MTSALSTMETFTMGLVLREPIGEELAVLFRSAAFKLV